MSGPSVHVGMIVHLVVDDRGRRCCAALVTAVADPTDAYRNPTILGVRAWTDTDEVVLPLPLGGAQYDPGYQPKGLPWACDGLDHATGTWHHITTLVTR